MSANKLTNQQLSSINIFTRDVLLHTGFIAEVRSTVLNNKKYPAERAKQNIEQELALIEQSIKFLRFALQQEAE